MVLKAKINFRFCFKIFKLQIYLFFFPLNQFLKLDYFFLFIMINHITELLASFIFITELNVLNQKLSCEAKSNFFMIIWSVSKSRLRLIKTRKMFFFYCCLNNKLILRFAFQILIKDELHKCTQFKFLIQLNKYLI